MHSILLVINAIKNYLTVFWFESLLIGTGLYFTLYLGIPQLRYFKQSVLLLIKKPEIEKKIGDISPLQALFTSLSGSIGVGSTTGVAIAIHLAGPASLFWILVTAFLGMATKLVEVTLSQPYREKSTDGTMAGGPMYYMKNRLKKKWLGVIFTIAAIITTFSVGNLPQANSIAKAMQCAWGMHEVTTGLLMSLLIAFVILGGIQRIGQVAEKLVPLMTILYFIGAFLVIGYHYNNLIPAFCSIFTNIFSGTAMAGGFLGGSALLAFGQGVNKGLFATDAGSGLSAIVHASSYRTCASKEGKAAMLEPFISTVIMCMLTGMAILSSNAWTKKVYNTFDETDINIIKGIYDDTQQQDRQQLARILNNTLQTPPLDTVLVVQAGVIQNQNITFLHARSVAEAVQVWYHDQLFTGTVPLHNGQPRHMLGMRFTGHSLLQGSNLVAHAFYTGILGNWGIYIVSISLLFFAFTTTMAWYYIGDRSLVFLEKKKYLLAFKIIFIAAVFLGAVIDTTIIWQISNFSYVLMTIPNIIGILWLRKDIKFTLKKTRHV